MFFQLYRLNFLVFLASVFFSAGGVRGRLGWAGGAFFGCTCLLTCVYSLRAVFFTGRSVRVSSLGRRRRTVAKKYGCFLFVYLHF
jgi:hypothetical protein